MVSLSNDVSHLKGKRRKVSAIRIFPPHCGRKAPRVVEFSQHSGSGSTPSLPKQEDDVFHSIKQDISESCGENDPWVNQHPKQGGLVTAKQEYPDGCGVNDPPQPKEECVLSIKREFCDGCGENDLQTIKHTLKPNLREDAVVSMKQESPDCCLQNSPMIDAKIRKGIAVSAKRRFPPGCGRNTMQINAKPNESGVSAKRRFPPGCGRNAPQIDAKPNESGVSVEKMRLEVDDTFVGPPIEQTGSSTMELGGFELSKSSSQIVSLDSPEALMSETASSLAVLNQPEVPVPVNILEPMLVKQKAGDVVSTRREFHDGVAVENPEDGKNGVLVEPPAIQTFGSPVELWTFELTENSGQTGSSKSPKSLISETTNEPEVLDCSEAPDPIELVEPMLVDNHKSLNPAELMNSTIQAELETTGSMKSFNQTKLFPSIKNPGGLEFRDSQAGEKECSSNLLQLPVDSVLPVMQGQPQVSDQPHASDPVETARKKMHKKYPPPRRISACRDFPPRCALNSSCSVVEIGSFRDACVDNGTTGVLITSEHSVRDHANQKSEKVEDADMFGDKTQVSLSGAVGIQMVEHVLVRGFDSKLKQEDTDATNIQSPCENSISESDLESFPSESKVDRESKRSGEDVATESVKFGNSITLKRKLPGMSFDENCTANHYQVLENVGSEFSSERVVNLALMSAENCPWSIGKQISKPPGVRSHRTEKRKQKKHEEGSLAIASQSQTQEIVGLELYDIQVTAQAEKASSICPWNSADQKLNVPIYLSPVKPESSGNADDFIVQDMIKSVSGRKKAGVENSKMKHKKKKPSPSRDVPCEAVPVEEDAHTINEDESPSVQTAHAMDLSLIPFGLHPAVDKDNGNEACITRNRVRETLRLFQGVVRKLLQDAESKSKTVQSNNSGRVDLVSARILKENNKWVNIGRAFWGNVPGVEVGDEFHYRVELAIVGLHRPYQSGIDYSKMKGEVVATSIVASGGYADVMDSSDVLVYSGQGGLPINGNKKAEDQKLERGNLALKNSIDKEIPVRVIRGYKEMDSRGKMVATYTYDGLYLVEKYWEEKGCYDTNVFKFQLRRIPGQPELAIKEVKKSTRSKVREGLCVNDISQGKEKRPICAINTVDDEKPPPFEYITTMIYPSRYNLTPPDGCNCTNGCSDSDKCSCALKNGGEIPFNYDGAIVEAKSLVYECGPSCKCPPSCHNRVSQRGIKFQLEIFKTEKRGWGVRSLNSIPSGSFICEYTGELLRDKEAEERTSNDEYLFDIGHNYSDPALWQGLGNLIPLDSKSDISIKTVEGEGFTIDAAYYGSVGRFVNHSCSPNLYAQNVLYDHDDKSMPHIMLFAAENIPPLQELSYHYNYELDQVLDSDGNIKKKSCYCGSHECTGRMY